MGDVAQNDGEAGYATRHYLVLVVLAEVYRSVWGGMVEREPQGVSVLLDTRPDLKAAGARRASSKHAAGSFRARQAERRCVQQAGAGFVRAVDGQYFAGGQGRCRRCWLETLGRLHRGP